MPDTHTSFSQEWETVKDQEALAMTMRALFTGLTVIMVLTVGCGKSEDVGGPAPVGQRAALEKLAQEYERIAAELPISPRQLPPKQRKVFLEQVFAASGYSYSATLHSAAEGGWDKGNEHAKDLAQLLILPHSSLRPEQSLSGVYSEQEEADLLKLEALLQ